MILGIDTSTYLEELANDAKYFVNGIQVDPLDVLRTNGVDHMRIRLWNNPFDKNGVAYLGGTCGVDNFLQLATLAQSKGYKILLDFHYSDFWADPAKQLLPKAWSGYSVSQLEQAVYQFTKDVLLQAKVNNIDIAMVQVGNEITNGILWPHGQLTGGTDGVRNGYDKLVKFLKAGISACREIFPEAKIVLHLERSYDQAVYTEFFTQMQQYNVDYDIIGMSYYPYWHGTMDMFFANVNNCKKFGKPIINAELGYGFTTEGCVIVKDGVTHQVALNTMTVDDYGVVNQYPLTQQGQATFIKDFIARAEQEGLAGVFYWEPLWLPGENICWASHEGQDYIHESGKPTANEVANCCLFDYFGNALPSLYEFAIKRK